VETGRDHFILADNKKELENRLQLFINSNLPLDLLRKTFDLTDQPNFKLEKVKSFFKKYEDDKVEKYYHKPFYFRRIYYDRLFLRRHSKIVMQHLKTENNNLALVLKKRSTESIYSHCFCSNSIVDRNFLGGQSYVFPLWIYEGEDSLFGASKRSNVKPEFEQIIEKKYKNKDLTEEIFYYIYAIFYSNIYRKKYAEFLKIDFPRVPSTKDYNLFIKIGKLGKRLVDLHLLKSDEPSLLAFAIFSMFDSLLPSSLP
jgi:predicted helicase